MTENVNNNPSFKKKFVTLFRHISSTGGNSNRGSKGDGAPPRPDTFIHKYLNGETKRKHPKILSGRNCDDLPPVCIGRMHRKVYSAFTGPGGGLASVNQNTHTLDIPDQDVDFIDDADEDLPDDQPNAYVTCQRPPPRKSPFSDIAEYFRKPNQTPKPAIGSNKSNNNNDLRILNNNDNHFVRASESSSSNSFNHYASKDSLECTAPAWKGEAPSPLSPNPSRAPHNAFLKFGDSPLTYELTVPPQTSTCVTPNELMPPSTNSSSVVNDINSTRSCENICLAGSPVSNPGSLGGGSLGSLEEASTAAGDNDAVMLVSCVDSANGAVNSLVIPESESPTNGNTNDLNSNQVLKVTECHSRSASLSPKHLSSLTNNNIKPHPNPLSICQSMPTTPRPVDDTSSRLNPESSKCVSLQQKILQQSLANKSANCRNNNVADSASVPNLPESKDLTNEGGLISHRAKFLTLELVEGCTLSAPHPALRRSETEEIAGVMNWNQPSDRAFGMSTTLYERHPVTRERAGNPIADSFGVVARYDSGLLALADGVNWGEKACLAARCAIHGCLSQLNAALYSSSLSVGPKNTTDLFVALLRSFHSAHTLILQEKGNLTTLTAAVVAPISPSKFVVCVCNVGDSLAYVYSQKHGVREVTQASHDINSMRDMRDALGALGPVDGQNPELNNLTCSMTYVEEGDLVFLTSDGISDNFDPVVGKFVLPKKVSDPSKMEFRGKTMQSTGSQTKTGRKHQTAHNTGQQKDKFKLNNRQEQLIQKYQHKKVRESTSSMKHFRQAVSRSKSQPSVNSNYPDGSKTEGRRSTTLSNKTKKQSYNKTEQTDTSYLELLPPEVEAHQRHELALLRMEDLLRSGLTDSKPVTNAQSLCLEMVHFATKLTLAKRRVLEDPDLYPPSKVGKATDATSKAQLTRNEQRNRRRKASEKLALVPGKLDHATVVAYLVGYFDPKNPPTPEQPLVKPLDPIYHLESLHHTNIRSVSSAAPLASPDSAKSVASTTYEDSKSEPYVPMPKLPENSPPRTRARLAKQESVETLLEPDTGNKLELENRFSSSTGGNKLELENRSSKPRQYGRRGKTTSDGTPLAESGAIFKSKDQSAKDLCGLMFLKNNVDSNKSSVPATNQNRKSSESISTDNQSIGPDQKHSLQKKAGDKENLSPNVDLPSTSTSETLL